MLTCVLGIGSTIWQAATLSKYYENIVRGCGIRNSTYHRFEESMFILVYVLKCTAYVIFMLSSCYLCYCNLKKVKKGTESFCKTFWSPWQCTERITNRRNPTLKSTFYIVNERFWVSHIYVTMQIVFLLFMLGSLIAALTFGNKRDKQYSNSNDCDGNHIELVTVYSASKGTHHIFGWIICIVAFAYSVNAISKWIVSERNEQNNGDINDAIKNDKYFDLQKYYHSSGKSIQPVLNALKYWFCAQFLAYLISMVVHLVHIFKPLFSNSDIDNINEDDLHSAVNVTYNFFAFLIPFSAGMFLNYIHSAYHESMANDLITYGGAINFPFGVCTREEKDYVAIALQKKSIEKKNNFDFIPSILGISIPLDNPGYIFAIILTIGALVFDSITF